MGLKLFLFIYIIGGITFIPLLIACVLLAGHLSWPVALPTEGDEASESVLSKEARLDGGDKPAPSLELSSDRLREILSKPLTASGYFAVTRQFVRGGVSSAPETNNNGSQPSLIWTPKRNAAGNVFFVELRHSRLVLHSTAEPPVPKHVIPLNLYDIDIYSGKGETDTDDGEKVPEAELFIRRHAIRLRYRKSCLNALPDDDETLTHPYFIYCDNCSNKEDFYHALVTARSQAIAMQESKNGEPKELPPGLQPLHFEQAHREKLQKAIDSSDKHKEMAWFNGLVGSIFMSVYKTGFVESLIRTKLAHKFGRLPTPDYIKSLKVQGIELGNAAPMILNPELKKLDSNGETIVGFDLQYNGGFRIEVSATVDVGMGYLRMKNTTVTIMLSVLVKSVEGRMLMKLKPPPSNRLWVAFEKEPIMDLLVVPQVASRQANWAIISEALKRVMFKGLRETIVLPNWDDTPFLDSADRTIRGGIWEANQPLELPFEDEAEQSGEGEDESEDGDDGNSGEKSSSLDTDSLDNQALNLLVTGIDPVTPPETLFSQGLNRADTAASGGSQPSSTASGNLRAQFFLQKGKLMSGFQGLKKRMQKLPGQPGMNSTDDLAGTATPRSGADPARQSSTRDLSPSGGQPGDGPSGPSSPHSFRSATVGSGPSPRSPSSSSPSPSSPTPAAPSRAPSVGRSGPANASPPQLPPRNETVVDGPGSWPDDGTTGFSGLAA